MRNKLSNMLWGLFFVIIGVGFAGNVLFDWEFDLFFRGWWTLFIIIPCFISMIQSKFNAAPTVGFIIGVLLLIQYYVNLDFSIWKLIVPAIFILIGLKIMFQGINRRKWEPFGNTVNMDGQQTYSNINQHEYNAVFSGNRVHLDNEVFNGTNLSAVFGSIVLDLRDAIIQHDVEINATTVFAGIDIYIPRGVKVKINSVPIFGGVSDKTTKFNDPAAPTIFINATCMFGGIDIK